MMNGEPISYGANSLLSVTHLRSPPKMNHSHLLSDVMQLRQPSFVATFGQIAKEIPDAIMLSVGSPNATLFPFKEMTLTMRNGQDITVDEFMMKKCLQYGSAKGFEPLLEQLKILTKKLHEPPQWENKDIVVLAGSQMGIGLVFEMLVNPEDFVITPEPTYPGIFNALQPLPHQLVSVTCDSEGVRPDDLKDVLEKCRSSSKGKPKVMYVNPSGNNPTGVVWSESRRRLVYEIACQYDIIILEDDPYYLLEFSETLTPSFLHLDSENRVIRLDSFSKTVSAGIRLGYATGSKDLIEKLRLLMMCTINHVSLVAQYLKHESSEETNIDEELKCTAKRKT
ncbi:kynurenine/alpha-aminoadipate aminotransferase, mitochondrial-like [Palaemon carinicauda]|uniref:kynurenine/alpha-aminoadipate aminotransferase, mitochondrial-like n=1 Tax=Palaemon carinicauda TaxID=392227 RepID=UPI0035B5FBC5